MFLTLIVSAKSLLPCEVSYSRVLRMGCGHFGGITVILSIMGGSTHSHTSLNQFIKQHNKAKSSCLCLERCIFSLEFSICHHEFTPRLPQQQPQCAPTVIKSQKAVCGSYTQRDSGDCRHLFHHFTSFLVLSVVPKTFFTASR